MSNIPNAIHQIWFQGENELPEKYQVFRSTWMNQMNFNYKLWDGEDIYKFIQSSNDNLLENLEIDCLSVYNSFPTMIQKIDFAKYLILYVYGGVYIDMDSFAIKQLNEFLDINSDLTFMVFPHNVPCTAVTLSKGLGLKGTILINNAVIFSTPLNERIAKVIKSCANAQQGVLKMFVSKQLKCLVTTGPVVFTNSVRSIKGWEKCVMPIETFEPYTNLEVHTLANVNDPQSIMRILISGDRLTKTYGIHIFDVNWFDKGKRHWRIKLLRQLYRKRSN